MTDYLEIAERADLAAHDVAQVHLSEFVGDVDLYPEADDRT
jgi:hypothetical protein